eukprot:TRINITY_DN5574_c0_g8_i1.p1 TRINITY_DN5574_c0_g8~~TRINITY_DN5574_c0_g8_i1.p1  ORF type:complete len:102 (+),score=30.38 TRINITY_DN5574_c0_g8_i1:233-538(+)
MAFSGITLFAEELAASRGATIVGGFLCSILYIFLLTAVTSLKDAAFGSSTHGWTEVLGALLISSTVASSVHRVCVTTGILFSLGHTYFIRNYSNSVYRKNN